MFALLVFILLNLVQAQANPLVAQYTSKVSLGDGSVFYLNPKVLYQGKAYYIPISTGFSGGSWENFSPTGFCVLAGSPFASSGYSANGFMFLENIPLLALNASGSFIRAEEQTQDAVPIALYCRNAEKPGMTKSHFVFNMRSMGNGVHRIFWKGSYVRLPFTQVDDWSGKVKSLVPEKAKFAIKRYNANGVCIRAGFTRAIQLGPEVKFQGIVARVELSDIDGSITQLSKGPWESYLSLSEYVDCVK